MRKNVIAMLGLFVAVLFGLTGCGGGGGSSTPQTTAISGTVTFPTSNVAAKVVAAATTAANLEIRDLTGALITTVPLTLQSGTANTYTYPAVNLPIGKDYVLKAVNGSMVMRALVDKAALADASTSKNVNNVTTTAVIVIEKNLAVTPGTLGQTAITAPAQAILAASPTSASIESNITAALVACTSTTGTATTEQAQLASLANIVTAAVSTNVDPGAFVAGTSTTTTVNAVTYTVSGSGSVTTNSTAPITTAAADTFATVSLPQFSSAGSTTFTVASAGSFTVTGTGSLSVSGALPSGVTFNAATGVLSGTPATSGTYPLTFTITNGGFTATQAFTLTVNPASAPSTSVGFTADMLSGKTFTEGQANIIRFNTDGTFIASDSPNAMTWSVNSSGQVVVKSATSSTTVTLVSGSLTTGFKVSLANSDGTTESSTITLRAQTVTSIIGTWGVYGNPIVETKIISFVDSTHYMIVTAGPTDSSGGSGLEYGTYTYDPATGLGTLAKSPLFDTNGQWGASHPPAGTSYSIFVSGDTLIVGNSVEGNLSLPRLKSSTTNPVVGAWWSAFTDKATGKAGGVLMAFLDDTHCLLAQAGNPNIDITGETGIELGTYAINATTHVLSTSLVVDTNGEWGFSNPPQGSINTVSVSGNTLTISNTVEGDHVATRVQ